MSTATQPLHLVKLEIDRFMRVHALSVAPNGKHLEITGRNGSGKTSILSAIWQALAGADSKAVPEPLQAGESRASVKLDLGEYLAERRWTEAGGTSLIVTAADGSRVAKPQQLLEGLLGRYALDPVAFLSRRPRDQVDDVLALCGARPPVAAVEAIVEEPCPVRPGESADSYLQRLSGDEVGLYYQRRREVGREADRKESALLDQEKHLATLGGPLIGDEANDAGELLRELTGLEAAADRRRAIARAAEEAKNDWHKAVGKIKEQEGQAQDLRRQLADLEGRLVNNRDVEADLKAELEAALEGMAALPDVSTRIAQLRNQVQEIEQRGKAHQRRRASTEQVERLRQEAGEAKARRERADEVLAELRELRQHLLDGLDLGIEGLELGDGELRYKSVPLRQAARSEQLRIAAAVAMAQKPRLRLLRVDNGEQLDRAGRELLLGLAQRQGWQVVMTAVAEGELAVEIVEGT